MVETDDSEHLQAAVADAVASSSGIWIVGHGSKPYPVSDTQNSMLCTEDHRGILEYRPDELVITARAGTRLEDLRKVLESHGQALASDPPMFKGQGTVGGAIASGFSGPGRPWHGSLRDSLLGIEVLNGLGQRLKFGGKVIKNVAGFDVTPLFAGSRGTLGVILSASFKLVPKTELTATVLLGCSEVDALDLINRYRRTHSTLSATCYFEGTLRLRFSGAASAVRQDASSVEEGDVDDSFSWEELRDHKHAFFSGPRPLWRVSLQRGALFENPNDLDYLVEWGGSLVWIRTKTDDAPRIYRQPTAQVAGFRNVRNEPGSHTKYGSRIKAAFDPHELFNRGIVV